MKCSIKMLLLALGVAALLVCISPVVASPTEPIANPAYRDLRTDYVRNWYIFSDEITDGVLMPGDTHVETMQNCWTSVSSGTMHNDSRGPYGQGSTNPTYTFPEGSDYPTAPLNYATTYNPTGTQADYWFPQKEDRIGFYMNYSQRDNELKSDWYNMPEFGGTLGAYNAETEGDKNGFSFGWVTNAIKRDPITGLIDTDNSARGGIKMDIYVHNGKFVGDINDASGFGANISNPNLSASNDISEKARDPYNGLFHVPSFDEAADSYTPAANAAMTAWYEYSVGKASKTLSAADLVDIVNSMDIRELESYGITGGASRWDAIFGDKTPAQILANLQYEYQDAFMDRGTYAENSSDGGVIAGLGGMGLEGDPTIDNWADQQVIRIDIDLDSGEFDESIKEIAFYDFGYGAGSGQTNIREIIFGIDRTQTVEHGQIFYDTLEGRVWFPENRIYIAQVVPEPVTMILLGIGGLGLAVKQVRRKK